MRDQVLDDRFRRADQRIAAGAAREALAVEVVGLRVVGAGELLLLRHVVVDGLVVGLRHGVLGVVVLRLRLGFAADDVADGVDADLAPRLRRPLRMSSTWRRPSSMVEKVENR